MPSDLSPTYELEELTLYEVKLPVPFPIAAPSAAELQALALRAIAPFERYPFLTQKELGVELSFTLSNLDEQAHNVDLLIDPWNEFGRYVPGLADSGQDELAPNLSGIQLLIEVPGTSDTRSSRRRGTLTFEDFDELAIDFATAMNIIANPPESDGDDDLTVAYVNHAFAIEQRSNRDPLSKPYIPAVIPGLTGIEIGLRTRQPANVALEVVIELVDHGSDKILERESSRAAMQPPQQIVSAAAPSSG